MIFFVRWIVVYVWIITECMSSNDHRSKHCSELPVKLTRSARAESTRQMGSHSLNQPPPPRPPPLLSPDCTSANPCTPTPQTHHSGSALVSTAPTGKEDYKYGVRLADEPLTKCIEWHEHDVTLLGGLCVFFLLFLYFWQHNKNANLLSDTKWRPNVTHEFHCALFIFFFFFFISPVTYIWSILLLFKFHVAP